LKPYPIHCVSIVIPVYNEQESLPELLRRTRAACQQLAYEYEIVLVDDGSRDKSAQLLEDAAAEDGSNVVAVILNRNYGQHAAIMAGFEQCRGDVVITLDADLQNPPEEIPRLVEQAALGYDVVATVRNNRQDSAFRRWPSRLINLAVQRSTGVAMTTTAACAPTAAPSSTPCSPAANAAPLSRSWPTVSLGTPRKSWCITPSANTANPNTAPCA
jgi:undecaprenyl-phosphate 4-deoxy-4-formamido-L-arabinose transferase